MTSTAQPKRPPKKADRSAAVQIVKTLALALLALVLGAVVIFCVIEVGDLNAHASVLQACLDKPATAGCSTGPITSGQIASIKNEADTLGDVGWVAFLMLIFTVGEDLMARLRR
ncbi:MAG TPA: hypothetical protein VLF91_03430 [Candidatus Saccharimonadales bacterium]|nr:hypothetical protein [Candidatus Saccharimonadales bacterium]